MIIIRGGGGTWPDMYNVHVHVCATNHDKIKGAPGGLSWILGGPGTCWVTGTKVLLIIFPGTK